MRCIDMIVRIDSVFQFENYFDWKHSFNAFEHFNALSFVGSSFELVQIDYKPLNMAFSALVLESDINLNLHGKKCTLRGRYLCLRVS